MEIDSVRFIQSIGDLYGITIRIQPNSQVDLLLPAASDLYTTDQFPSAEELRYLFATLPGNTYYCLTDHAGVCWLLLGVQSHAILCGPLLQEILTRVETGMIYEHLRGTYQSIHFYYEGENQNQRRFREYMMHLPLFNARQLDHLAALLQLALGSETLQQKREMNLLGFDPYMLKQEDISKYISYYEDCEAGLAACIAHGSSSKSQEFVATLYQHGSHHDWNDALYRYAIISALIRTGARRAGVPAAASERILEKYRQKAFQSHDASLLQQVACELAHAMCQLVQTCSNHNYTLLVSNVIHRIRTGFSEKISTGSIAVEFGCNASYLSMCFKKETGETVSSFLNRTRLEYARTLLTISNLDICDIGVRAGIPDPSYFSKKFKEAYGLSPSEYKHKLLGKSLTLQPSS